MTLRSSTVMPLFGIWFTNFVLPWESETTNIYWQGAIESDEGFFSTEIPEEKKHETLKRGRGSQKRSKVLVMAESTEVESTQGGQEASPGGLFENERDR